MGQACRRIIVAVAASLCAIAPLRVDAEPYRHVVYGHIADAAGRPIPGAKVVIFDNDRPLVDSYTNVNATGDFQIVGIILDSDHVLLEFTAPGYETSTRVVRLDRPDVKVPNIELHKAQSLEIEGAVVSHATDGAHDYVELILHNISKRPVSVNDFRVVGSAPAKENCIDAGPAVVFTVADLIARSAGALAIGSVRISTAGPHGAIQTLDVESQGELQFHKCAVSGLRLVLPYLLRLDKDEHVKLRLELPTRLTLREGQAATQIALSWISISVDTSLATSVERTL